MTAIAYDHDLATPDETERCKRRRWDGTELCSMPGTPIDGMCVHEHLSESRYCEHHMADAASGALICVACRTGPEPHLCPVRPIARAGA